MSLDRQDVRARLDHEYHQAMLAICNARGITVADYVEALLIADIFARVHEAQAIAADAPVLGRSATNCDTPGKARR